MTRRNRRFAHIVIALTVAACAVASLAARQADPEVRLRAAMKMETVDGNLQAAIKEYQQLAKSTNRSVAAKALARLGQCYEKLGTAENDRARKAYEEIVASYADQSDAVALARTRLAALVKPAGGGTTTGRFRLALEPNFRGGLAISRDGRYFAQTVRNGRALRIRDLVTGDQREIELGVEATGYGPYEPVILSPDGRLFAYTWGPGGPGGKEVRVVSTSGGAPRVLVNRGAISGSIWGWSPDGKEIYMYVWKDGADKIDRGSRMAISVADGAIRQLPDWRFDIMGVPSDMDLSPDARYVVYARWPNYTGKDRLSGRTPPAETYVAVADVATGKEVRITTGDSVDSVPFWSSDGSAVLFLRHSGGEYSLWNARVKDGQPVGAPSALGTFASRIVPVALTSDGAFHYLREENIGRRYIVNVGSDHKVDPESSPIELPLAGGYAYGWSPDSRMLAILVASESARAETGDPRANDIIAIRDVASGATRELRPGLRPMTRPRWSPDGRTILVAGRREKTYGFWGVDASSGAVKLLVQVLTWNSVEAPAAEWTPDGRGLMIARRTAQGVEPRGHELVHHDLASGRETVRYTLTKGFFLHREMSVASDGTAYLLAYLRNDDKPTIRAVMAVPGDGEEPRVVFERPYQYADALASSVAADGQGVWVALTRGTRDNPDARELLWVPVNGGQPVSSGLNMAGLEGVVPSPDGSKLILIQNRSVHQLWTVERVLPTKKGT